MTKDERRKKSDDIFGDIIVEDIFEKTKWYEDIIVQDIIPETFSLLPISEPLRSLKACLHVCFKGLNSSQWPVRD